MPRILIAGFQHETNTFAATRATMADFEMADSWPGLLRGDDVISGTAGTNLPLAGFVRQAQRDNNVELIPAVWAAAEPSSYVTNDAFETIAGMILDGVRNAGEIDGIYLDLHGAMVTEGHEDGEGEILRRLRALTGPDLPIVISLDLHANMTQAMIDLASAITMFRTYPHLDMAETGARAFEVLRHLLDGGTVFPAFRQGPCLIPAQTQYTGTAPFDRLYNKVDTIGSFPSRWAELAAGFPAADIHDAGPSVLAYAETPETAAKLADDLLAELAAAEPDIDCTLLEPSEAARLAMDANAETGKPAIIADVQDNPGAGATSDTTGLLQALIEAEAQSAVIGMLNDPETAARAHRLGQHAEFEGELGGKAGPHPVSYNGRFRVEALSDGRFAFTGEMYAGGIADAGPTTLLRVLDISSDIRVVVSSKRCQCLDQSIFAHIGIEPAGQKIIVVKSTVHFRADFEGIAGAVINAGAPGLFCCDLDQVAYKNLRSTVRRMPFGTNSASKHIQEPILSQNETR